MKKVLSSLRYLPYNKKTFNRFLLIFQRKILKNSYVKGYPYKMTFDVCNICPLKCKLCPTGQGEKGRSKGIMPFKTFKKVIDEVGDYLFYINLYDWGEPFINKNVYQMIDYAKRKGIKTILSTTFACNFTEKNAEDLVKSGLDFLLVSLDGASQKTTEIYQRGINFDKIMGIIKMISNKKKILGKKKPLLQWRFIVMSHNQHEVSLAKKLIKNIGFDRLEIAKVRPDMGREIFFDSSFKQFDSLKKWLPEDETYSLYSHKNKKKKLILKNDCSWLWAHPVINWNGSVSPCELIYNENHDFGNINDSSFRSIWNNPKYISARKEIKGFKGGNKTICSICHLNNAME